MTLEQARAEAAKHLSDVHMHGEPVQLTKKRRNDGVVTLESFLTDRLRALGYGSSEGCEK